MTNRRNEYDFSRQNYRFTEKEWMSQEELANQLGVSRQAVSKWESSSSIPDLNKIISIFICFLFSCSYLICVFFSYSFSHCFAHVFASSN